MVSVDVKHHVYLLTFLDLMPVSRERSEARLWSEILDRVIPLT